MGSVKEIRAQFDRLMSVEDTAVEQKLDGSRVVLPVPAKPKPVPTVRTVQPQAFSD
jgi:hypothetical protein